MPLLKSHELQALVDTLSRTPQTKSACRYSFRNYKRRRIPSKELYKLQVPEDTLKRNTLAKLHKLQVLADTLIWTPHTTSGGYSYPWITLPGHHKLADTLTETPQSSNPFEKPSALSWRSISTCLVRDRKDLDPSCGRTKSMLTRSGENPLTPNPLLLKNQPNVFVCIHINICLYKVKTAAHQGLPMTGITHKASP